MNRRSNRVVLAVFLFAFATVGILPSSRVHARFGVSEAWALGDPDDPDGRLRMPEDGGGVTKPPIGPPRLLKPVEVARLILAQSRVLVWMLVRTAH